MFMQLFKFYSNCYIITKSENITLKSFPKANKESEWCTEHNTFGTGDKKTDILVQSLSPVQLFATPWTAALQASLSITNSWSLLKLMSIESGMPSNHPILCHPLLLPPSIFPNIRVFSMSQFFASGGQSIGAFQNIGVFQLQHQSFQWIFRTDLL